MGGEKYTFDNRQKKVVKEVKEPARRACRVEVFGAWGEEVVGGW